MCTLTLWWQMIADAPVLVAANRDERPDRPWQDPAPWPAEPQQLFAGRDLVAGGTWLGVNRHRLICAITNRWGPENDPRRRSRGLVVRDALRAGSALTAAAALERLLAGETNPFALLLADEAAAFRVDSLGGAVEVRPLARGITVLANWGSDERMPRSERALALAREVPTESMAAALPAVERLLADHQGAEDPRQPICVHGQDYGTVGSTIVAAGADRLLWRDLRGTPCSGVWTEREVP